MQYWFNVETREVESHDDPKRARSANLMGPYDTHDDAQRALEKAAERNTEWDEEDRRDDGWGDDEATP